jgi:hypothetical protein
MLNLLLQQGNSIECNAVDRIVDCFLKLILIDFFPKQY